MTSDAAVPTICVALATYQGASYVECQLSSILPQLSAADELIVADDASRDETLEVVRRVAERSAATVRILPAEQNSGSTANFERAIAACRNEIIVLSDQDDCWHPRKLEAIRRVFQRQPATGLVFSDAEMVDQDLQPLGYGLWEAIRLTPRHRSQFRSGHGLHRLLKRYCVTGATMAFRSQYRNVVLPIPRSWVHDAWIALIISALAPCVPIEERLIQYRQHGKQQIGEQKRGLCAQFLIARRMGAESFESTARNFELASQRFREQSEFTVSAETLNLLDAKVDHWRIRAQMRDLSFRLPQVLSELCRGRYSRFSMGWKSVLQDLLL